jgi:UMF1 family MFS transporter
MQKDDKKIINAWASYDWANSVYNLIVTTAIFPVYYSNVTKDAFGGEIVNFAGWEVQNSVLFTYSISLSFLIIVLTSPILSGIADYLGAKKRFMQFFTYLGSLSCIGLYWFMGENIEYGIICSILASVGYAGSLVFYNGFLPEITYPDKMDSISAKGFTFGYVGSVILLIINLALLLQPDTFGFEDAGEATRFGFLLVGIWWMGFAQIAFYYLQDKPTGNKMDAQSLSRGIAELKKIATKVNQRPVMKKFLLSFFFYSMGVLTVMLLAPLFAEKEVNITSTEMIVVILILQILAIVGAYFFSMISTKKGSKFAISSILIIWMGICISCYFLQIKIGFYVIAAILGFGMGGVQSISRSTYARLIPLTATDTASYFSFFDITEKLAIVIGTFAYGLIEQLTGTMRNSMLFMTVFFVIGFIILVRIQLQDEMNRVAAGKE